MAATKDAQDNMRYYNQMRAVPENAKKPIIAGRTKGMTNISPMWRIQKMTETFGPCGIGWKYEITKQWNETYGEEIKTYCNVNLYIKVDGEWSEPIPGTGGSAFATKESKGIYVDDEDHKKALTDALSVAMKALGVGADVYFEGGADLDNKYNSFEVQFTDEIKAEIAAAKNDDQLKIVWYKYRELQNNAEFSGAVTARYDQLSKNGKS